MAGALAATSGDARRAAVESTLDRLVPRSGTPSDYPTPAFRLEIFVTALTLHLGNDWRPGKLDIASRRLVRDEAATERDVRLILP